jgi:hypothetical protein
MVPVYCGDRMELTVGGNVECLSVESGGKYSYQSAVNGAVDIQTRHINVHDCQTSFN